MILERAAELLAASPTGDISTRAVCEAAGVTQPVLYRLFGDKDGLLSAVVDEVWDEYLTMKRSAEPSDDALDDLRAGWDAHTAFAVANPHAYRLLFGTRLATRPTTFAEALQLLEGTLTRLAADGRLRMKPATAAQVIMAANSGIALALILRPENSCDLTLSEATRDATLGGILVDGTAGDEAGAVASAVTTLRTHAPKSEAFTPAEAGLLDEWLDRLSSHTQGENNDH